MMNCSEFKQLLPIYLEEKLEGAQRNEWRRHLRECRTCREIAIGREPGLLFVAGSPAPIDMEGVEQCTLNLGAMIRQEKLRKRMHTPRKWWYAAAAAALLVISGGLYRFGMVAPAELVTSEALQPTAAAVSREVQPPRMDVEMSHKGMRVYQFADTGDGNSAAYFIVDENLEL